MPLNVKFTVRVAVLPEALYDDPVPAKEHWLFDTVAVDPGVTPEDKTVPVLSFR